MSKIHLVNIKCGGCEQGIISALQKQGLKNIKVDVANQLVEFEGDYEVAKKVLTKLGYPEATSQQAKSLGKKAKSYLTCMIGRTKK